MKILGIPLGHPEHVQHQLQRVVLLTGSCWSGSLLSRICKLLGCCFLLCRHQGKFPLESHSPAQTEEYVVNHTASLKECLTRILGVDISPESWEVANLPLSLGGLGLRSAPRVSEAAYWSSWADCVQTTAKRQPAVAEQLVAALMNREPGRHLESAVESRERLLEHLFGEISQVTTPHALDEAIWTMQNQGPDMGGNRCPPWHWRNALSEMACGPASLPNPEHCSAHKEGLWRVCFTLVSPLLPTAGSTHNRSCLVVASLLAASSLHLSQLPVWLATQFSWPPLSSLRCGWGVGPQRLCIGECRRASLSSCAGHGLGPSRA